MPRRTVPFFRLLPLLPLCLAAASVTGCGSESDTGDGSTSDPGVGGALGSSGMAAVGGGDRSLGGSATGSAGLSGGSFGAGGGSAVDGGTTLGGSTGSGGAVAPGGATTLGGNTAAGGLATGGGTTTGGSSADGGSTAAGGIAASGGTTTAAGGTASGGSPTAGTSAQGGGSPAGGGSTQSGGSPAAGGTSAQGGGSPAGGSEAQSGGGPAGGGSTAAAGASGGEFGDRTAADLIGGLTLGWNLGNSLDAPEGETAWGNPEINPALLQAVADSGFDLVRIPVTWSLHMGPGPDYAIEPAFLARVEEVVQYAIDRDLTVIINLHHDGADDYDGVEWITLNEPSGAITEANNAAVRERFVAVWEQVAAHFAGFGEQLLFESMNEIHDGYDSPDPAYYDIINDLNQAFVDTVRASGDNNTLRHLVVPGYNTNIEYTLAGFELPQDQAPDRLIVSVHYYDPWDFAGAGNTQTWGTDSPGRDTWGQEDHVVSQFDQLKARFVDSGVPVVIGEYGAVNQAGYEEYRRYYMEYVTKAAVDRGILPIYWDNGSPESGEEAFGLFDRSSNTVLHPSILEAMMRAATSDYSLTDVAKPSP